MDPETSDSQTRDCVVESGDGPLSSHPTGEPVTSRATAPATRSPLDSVECLDMPVRHLRFVCEAERRFSLPAWDSLAPYKVLRGLIGGGLTAMSADLERRLFKVRTVSADGEAKGSAGPGTPWRLRILQLHARVIDRRFAFGVDLLGADPCDLAETFVDAVRLAGSSAPCRNWKTGRGTIWGISIEDEQGELRDKVPFHVVDVAIGPRLALRQRCSPPLEAWRSARAAMLVLRTRTILSDKPDRSKRGERLKGTGNLDAAAIVGGALRRLAALHVSTCCIDARRAEAEALRLRAQAEAASGDLARHWPLDCVDLVTLPEQSARHGGPRLAGMLGSAIFAGGPMEAWLPAFGISELLGIGESTSLGAGQAMWLPVP